MLFARWSGPGIIFLALALGAFSDVVPAQDAPEHGMGGSRNHMAQLADQAKLSVVDHFDYRVIGARSAGCVLAERLSADGR
jgi:hypothetical protein